MCPSPPPFRPPVPFIYRHHQHARAVTQRETPRPATPPPRPLAAAPRPAFPLAGTRVTQRQHPPPSPALTPIAQRGRQAESAGVYAICVAYAPRWRSVRPRRAERCRGVRSLRSRQAALFNGRRGGRAGAGSSPAPARDVQGFVNRGAEVRLRHGRVNKGISETKRLLKGRRGGRRGGGVGWEGPHGRPEVMGVLR